MHSLHHFPDYNLIITSFPLMNTEYLLWLKNIVVSCCLQIKCHLISALTLPRLVYKAKISGLVTELHLLQSFKYQLYLLLLLAPPFKILLPLRLWILSYYPQFVRIHGAKEKKKWALLGSVDETKKKRSLIPSPWLLAGFTFGKQWSKGEKPNLNLRPCPIIFKCSFHVKEDRQPVLLSF